MDHNVAVEHCSGFIMLAALANLLKVIILQLNLNAAKCSGRLTSPLASVDVLPPVKVVPQTGSQCCVPNPGTILKSRQHLDQKEIFIRTEYGLFCSKQHVRQMEL